MEYPVGIIIMEYAHRKAEQTLNNWSSNPTNGQRLNALEETKEVGKDRIEGSQRGKGSLDLVFPKEMKMQVKRSSLNFSLGIPASCKPHLTPVLRGKPRLSQCENILKRAVLALHTKSYMLLPCIRNLSQNVILKASVLQVFCSFRDRNS